MQILDQTQRHLALDVTQSFIVQAPAGSGKTELLTQRYLSLLATVEYPEEIVAITFTKKAASEMRNRILNALERAAYQPCPEEAHALATWHIAQQALQHSKEKQWGLLQNPNRLRVQTIDSLCASLAKQMPIMAQLGSQADIIEDAYVLYQQAADDLLATLEDDQPWTNSLAELLLHLDNNYHTVKHLLIAMLAHRDQWLPHILQTHHQADLRRILQRSLENVTLDALQKMEGVFSRETAIKLLPLVNFSRENQEKLGLTAWQKLPDSTLDSADDWQYLADLLLTQQSTWRKAINKNQGFPADGESKADKLRNKDFKQQMQSLLETFSENENLRLSLQTLKELPPIQYTDAQWQVLNNLLNLLPVLAAQLQLSFQRTGKIDFIALTQAALHALGDEDNPTDLGLHLDYKIQHLLIDEFQDTSASQYHLLERLISGWLPGDGRSLFLVGDPMQSIYRFRAAEVGLFLRAQQFGVGEISLVPLTLQVNFRSSQTIVDWINHSFSDIFPGNADIATGAVPLSAATAFHVNSEKSKIVALEHNADVSTVSEADTIVDIVKNADSNATIAILVRSRGQLANIIPVLQQQNISYQAIDIENLSRLTIIQDLLALTSALNHFADRLAWLSILRAPWCGLALNDLHLIAQQSETQTIWDNINSEALINNLSQTGQQQLAIFKHAMNAIIAERGRFNIAEWVYAAWLQLGGPAVVTQTNDLTNAQAFFELLAELDATEQFNIETLNKRLEKLFAKPTSTSAKLQIMTIHKAKGLEFDIVILPALQQRPQHDANKLLLWLERPRANNTEDLLLAPIKSKADAKDTIYAYLRLQHSIKQKYESMRVFYVAATRAKQQLYLLSTTDYEDEEQFTPISGSFLSMLWPTCQRIFRQSTAAIITPEAINTEPQLKRLQQPLNTPLLIENKTTHYHQANRPQIENYYARHTGTVIHEALQLLSSLPKDQWKPIITNKDYWLIRLQQLGLTDTQKAYADIELALTNVLDCATAQWLLQQSNGHSEYAISANIDNQLQHIIVDRTFVDNNIRWIVDYKSSRPKAEQSVAQFLQQEKNHYQAQLDNYAKIFQHIDTLPIKIGLYFPLCKLWIHWEFEELICQ